MIQTPPINISDFDYPLPAEKIANHPLSERDDSKLLVCKDGLISDHSFSEIHKYLPASSLLLLNDTRVIHARLLFHKTTGASIEIFCLEPEAPVRDIQLAMQQKESCVWNCMVGNAKKWKEGELSFEMIFGKAICRISAEVLHRNSGGTFSIRFSWNLSDLTFAELIETAGKVPLPPYIHREVEEEDMERYQTVFALNNGSVAAPTAGLHFTRKVFMQLAKKNISTAHLTLHVGAGTFKPVSTSDIQHHVMHAEQVIINKKLLLQLLHAEHDIIAVGTTSVRTVESLFWLGVKYLSSGTMPEAIDQWDAYKTDWKTMDKMEVLSALLSYLEENKLQQLYFKTSMIIIPGYNFRIVTGMITNFHQPKSTLLLLISAYLGNKWKEVYQHALLTDYRFLSYGDACLFLK
jgi:S-adenosylmethionine:tRNA ribosyltransferase-isomerase